MGRSSNFYCRTCKVEIYLGYGSYGTWLDDCATVEAFDARVAKDPELGNLRKNQAVRRALVEHAGHECVAHSDDWTFEKDGKLMGEFGPMGEGVPIIEDYGLWSRADYAGEKP